MELKLETDLFKKPSLEPNDTTALTREQQEKLNEHKRSVRIENEKYLREHPEVSALMSSFVSAVLLKRPAKVREFASEYFTDPTLPDRMKQQT